MSSVPSDAEPVWPGREADERPALRVYNPATQGLLDALRKAAEHLQAAFKAGQVDSADALGVASQVHQVEQQVRGLHYAAVGLADQSGLWGIAGYTSTNAWLRHTHLIGGRGANRVSRTARWLTNQPEVAQALGAGEISEAHVQVMRVVATSSPARSAAFRQVAAEFVEVARNADAEVLSRAMRSWGDVVDERAGDDEAQRSHEKRGLFLSPVAGGWDLRGWLSDADGAELAGLLNERVNQTRRDNPDLTQSAAQRRADALLDLARSAAAGGYSPAQRDRAKVLVLVPLARMTACPTCRERLGEQLLTTMAHRNSGGNPHRGPTGSPADDGTCTCEPGRESEEGEERRTPPARGGEPPDEAAGQWRVGNGTGRGQLPMTEVRRLSCEGVIQRVVLSPQSTVLDVGRAQRLVTPSIRTALEVRDGQCVIPGCDRPPGWCEAHHVRHWSAGGATALSNLVLACSRHHHEIHHGKWLVRIDEHGQVKVSQATRKRPRLARW